MRVRPNARFVRSEAKPFHWNVKSVLGQTFGKLKVIEEAGRNQKRMVLWRCQCDCGKVVTRQGSTLIGGKSTSCGCYRTDKALIAKRGLAQRKAGTALRNEFRHISDGARQRGYLFDIPIEVFARLSAEPCSYCGVPPSKRTHSAHEVFVSSGLDRVDNNVGYVEGNLTSCCTTCNYMKRALGRAAFLEHVQRIVNFQRRQHVACA